MTGPAKINHVSTKIHHFFLSLPSHNLLSILMQHNLYHSCRISWAFFWNLQKSDTIFRTKDISKIITRWNLSSQGWFLQARSHILITNTKIYYKILVWTKSNLSGSTIILVRKCPLSEYYFKHSIYLLVSEEMECWRIYEDTSNQIHPSLNTLHTLHQPTPLVCWNNELIHDLLELLLHCIL